MAFQFAYWTPVMAEKGQGGLGQFDQRGDFRTSSAGLDGIARTIVGEEHFKGLGGKAAGVPRIDARRLRSSRARIGVDPPQGADV
jgi:hypothetical protein